MKEFIKDLKVKKMKTGEVAEMIADNQNDLIDFYIKEAHRAKNADIIKELHSKMLNEKFIKALKKIIKAGKDSEGLDSGFVVIIAGLLDKNRDNDKLTDDIRSEYQDIINKLLKSRAKKIAKKVNLSEDVIKELLLITPKPGYISNDKFVGIYSQRMLRILYVLSANSDIGLTETSQVKTLFKKIFGKSNKGEDLLDLIAVNILLEKKECIKGFNDKQTAIWNLMTRFALEYINDQDKEHITQLIEYYCNRRRADAAKDRDSARRISLTDHVDAETYPKFNKAINKYKNKGKESLVKFL